jgi:hypothetical protein
MRQEATAYNMGLNDPHHVHLLIQILQAALQVSFLSAPLLTCQLIIQLVESSAHHYKGNAEDVHNILAHIQEQEEADDEEGLNDGDEEEMEAAEADAEILDTESAEEPMVDQ